MFLNCVSVSQHECESSHFQKVICNVPKEKCRWLYKIKWLWWIDRSKLQEIFFKMRRGAELLSYDSELQGRWETYVVHWFSPISDGSNWVSLVDEHGFCLSFKSSVIFPQLNQHQVQLPYHPKQLPQVTYFSFYTLKIRDRTLKLWTKASKTLRGWYTFIVTNGRGLPC